MTERARLPESSLPQPDMHEMSGFQPPMAQEAPPEAAISEVELVRIDPADAHTHFATHIERVEERYDITQIEKYTKAKYLPAMLTGACVGEAATTLHDYHQYSVPKMVAGIVWMGGSALAVGGTQLVRRHMALRRFERNNGQKLLEQVGHAYEVYRLPQQEDMTKGPKDTVIHWHGATVPKDTPESAYPSFLSSIRSITRLAEQNAVDSIVVDSAVLEKGMPELAASPEKVLAYPEQSLGKLIKSTKLEIDENVLAKVEKLHSLHRFTPQELRSFVEEQLRVAGIDSLISQLEATIDNDPMATLHGQLKQNNADPEAIRIAIGAASEQALVRNLETAPRVVEQTDQSDPTKTASRGEVTCRIINGQVEVRRTLRTKEGVTSTATMHPLTEMLPISDAQRDQFDDDASLLNPHQKKLIIYERLYSTARGERQTSDDDGTGGERPSQPVVADKHCLVQSAFIDSTLRPTIAANKITNVKDESVKVRLTTRAIVMGGAAMAAAIAVGFFHTGTISGVEVEAEFQRRIAVAAKSEDEPDIDRLVDQSWEIPGAAQYKPLFDFESDTTFAIQDFLGDSLPKSLHESGMFQPSPAMSDPYQGNEAGKSGEFSSVGNIDPKGHNGVEWYLNPHNMKTEGYWGAATYHQFAYDAWEQSSKGIQRWPERFPTTVDKNNTSYIAVQRVITQNQMSDLALPILEGTRPIAANIDGKPVPIQAGEDGSYVVNLEQSGKLTYYVDDDPHDTEGLRATRRTNMNFFSDDKLRPADLWKQAMPYRSEDDAIRRTQEMAYIKNHFTYSLEPLGSEGPRLAKYEGVNLITAEALSRKLANCNVAATILIADNVWLNYAEGWNNTNTTSGKQQILSTREAHAWAVNHDAHIFDATPATDDPKLNKYFSEAEILPPEENTNMSTFWKIGLGAGGIAMSSLAASKIYRRRESIAKNMEKARRNSVTALAIGANVVADAPGITRRFAVAARDVSYMGHIEDADQLRSAYVDAMIRRSEGPEAARPSELLVAQDSNRDSRLREAGVGFGTRLAVRTRLALRRFAQNVEQRKVGEEMEARRKKYARIRAAAMRNAGATSTQDIVSSPSEE